MSTHGWDDDHPDPSTPADIERADNAYFEGLRQREAKKLEEAKMRTDPYYAISVYKAQRDKLMGSKSQIDRQIEALCQEQQKLRGQIDDVNRFMQIKMQEITGDLSPNIPPPRYDASSS
jgi:hypothetical protein